MQIERLVCAEWGWAEYREAADCLLFERPRSGAGCAAMLAEFSRLYPQSVFLPVNRGRLALASALRVLARTRSGKTEVIYPAYICASVIAAIERAGLVPVPADIGPDLNIDVAQAARVVGSNTLAIIAAHVYGCPTAVGEFEKLCRSRDIFLVDDAACLVGVAGDDGRMLGSFGAAGIVSFTASKSIVSGGFNAGGLLLVNDPELVPAMRREWEALPEPRFQISDLLLFLRDQQLETYSRSAVYYWSALRRRLSRHYDGRHICPPARMADFSARLALRQLASLDRRIAGRVRVAEAFARRVAAMPGIGFPQYRPGRYLTRIVLQLPTGSDLAAVQAGLRQHGIETRRGYELDLRYGNAFARALAVAPLLIELPSHSRMAEAAIDRICAALGEVVGGAAFAPCPMRQSAIAG
ncbi:MAG TPA: DegT/DnrJ/EryC1/StrS family aminotransferase [Stellaceae bacterium]|nr:DegT/DnrJ/EryC1/StrS family aminotransferase [Stellaceae bacterium]